MCGLCQWTLPAPPPPGHVSCSACGLALCRQEGWRLHVHIGREKGGESVSLHGSPQGIPLPIKTVKHVCATSLPVNCHSVTFSAGAEPWNAEGHACPVPASPQQPGAAQGGSRQASCGPGPGWPGLGTLLLPRLGLQSLPLQSRR